MRTSTAILRLALPAVFVALLGCGSSPGQAAVAGPTPFVAQFADTYDVAAPSKSGIRTLVIDPDGGYRATFDGGRVESGSYTSSATAMLPVVAQLTDGTASWSLEITTATGDMTITRGDAHDTARPEHPVGPNESLCDASGGRWTDDDSDKDGLYCSCPADTRYVPSRGGCVAS